MSFIDGLKRIFGMPLTSEDGLKYKVNDGEVTIVGAIKNASIKEIPAYIEGFPVGVIGVSAKLPFEGDLTFPNTVHTIESCAFEDVQTLRSVTISRYVRNLGGDVFAGCEHLEEAYIDNNVDISLSNGLFDLCIRLKKVHLPEYAKKIPDEMFSDCEALEEICIPETAESIGEAAFIDCFKIKCVNLPRNLRILDEWAFATCKSLTEIELPRGLDRICEGTFDGCENLRKVIIPDTVKEIEEFAFSECPLLEMPEIPQGCQVHENAFGE